MTATGERVRRNGGRTRQISRQTNPLVYSPNSGPSRRERTDFRGLRAPASGPGSVSIERPRATVRTTKQSNKELTSCLGRAPTSRTKSNTKP